MSSPGPSALVRETIAVEAGDVELALQEEFHERGLTDGLPIVVPTTARVEAFIEAAGFARDLEVGPIPPSHGVATVENVAVNAVMAGCRPEQLCIVLTSLEAQLEERYNLAGIQVTTNPVAPLTIVNGPIRHRLGVDSGAHAYSGANNPNGPIGRAVRLALRNIGGAKGEVDRATLGMPSKYSFVLAENEEASPWEPLHVSLGFEPTDDVVTVVGPESIIDSCRPTFSSSEPILYDFAELMKSVGTNRCFSSGTLLWVVNPSVARQFAQEGWTRAKLQERLFEDAKFEWGPWGRWEGLFTTFTKEVDGKTLITESPADIWVVVAGRDDPLHNTYLPSVEISFAASRKVWVPGQARGAPAAGA